MDCVFLGPTWHYGPSGRANGWTKLARFILILRKKSFIGDPFKPAAHSGQSVLHTTYSGRPIWPSSYMSWFFSFYLSSGHRAGLSDQTHFDNSKQGMFRGERERERLPRRRFEDGRTSWSCCTDASFSLTQTE